MNGDLSDKASYYYAAGERILLKPAPDVVAVRFAPGQRIDSPTISSGARSLLAAESEEVDFIPTYDLHVFVLRSAGDVAATANDPEIRSAVSSLGREEGIEFASRGLRHAGDDGELMFATRRFTTQFKEELTRSQIDALNQRFGVRIVEALPYAPNTFLLEAPEGGGERGPVAVANTYFESGVAVFSDPEFVRRRHWRSGLTTASEHVREAPAFLDEQWHLRTARVLEAWELTRGRREIAVAVLDDGVDVSHAEFAEKVVAQFDFATRAADGTPKRAKDNHGTACAGVAVAAGVAASGVAPGCALIAARTPEFIGTTDEAKMFQWAADQGADAISCSWGPQDGTGRRDPLPDVVRAAIRYCVTKGRGGKGTPVVWAAGNGNESVSLDGYASNPDVIAVAASTSREARAFYSDFGPEIWVCAPSSGNPSGGERSIFTTDRRGSPGYNTGGRGGGDTAGHYTNTFGGTSSAAPLVAGVIGLVLSANPELSATGVREILRRTAVKIGSGYGANSHSSQFGFGRVDARAAVEAALGITPQPSGAPAIRGPEVVRRSGPPPSFEVAPGAGRFYAVEVATDPRLFDTAAASRERAPGTFYASWEDVPLLAAPGYALPEGAWARLRNAAALYFRIWTSSRADTWSDPLTTTPDREFWNAPSLAIVEPAAGQGPQVSGPHQWARNGDPPSFAVGTGRNQYFAVELAADPRLFHRNRHGEERTPVNFYGSWEQGLLRAQGGVSVFDVPDEVWGTLREGERLYYRLLTASAPVSWPDFQASLADVDFAQAPSVLLVGSVFTERLGPPIRAEEFLWRALPAANG